MITMLGSRRQCCDGITRRQTLQAGGLAMLGGLFGAAPATLPAAVDTRKGKARSVIVLYLLGGAPTQDMFDMKPDAPGGVGGEFKPIPSSAAGIEVCELLPRSARWMHKAALVRTVNHQAGCHNPMPSLTGYPEPLPSIGVVQDRLPPSMGSVCQYLDSGQSEFPAYVHMPCMLGWGQHIRRAGPYAGFLGRRYDPLFTECAPTSDKPSPDTYHPQVVRGAPQLPVAQLPAGVTLDRLDRRRRLKQQIDDILRQGDHRRGEFTQAQQGALTLLTSRRVREAFDVDNAPASQRDRYGNTLFGSSALIARKLVEQGVRFVNVTWDIFWTRPAKLDGAGWDTHQRNFPILREVLLPNYDQTFSALMEDLAVRGLLEDTLVVVMSDMGRTPKINKHGGRDHWTFCFSVLFAGAGIRGGTVYGQSDKEAAYVKDKPVSPADICATIYACLGIDPETQVPDASGQPVRISMGGRVIDQILA